MPNAGPADYADRLNKTGSCNSQTDPTETARRSLLRDSDWSSRAVSVKQMDDKAVSVIDNTRTLEMYHRQCFI